jgi:homoserine dehydrogenase
MHTIRYAILGFGNVGTALAAHVAERRGLLAADYDLDFRLAAVTDSTALVADPEGLDPLAVAHWKESKRRLAEWPGARPLPSPDELGGLVDCVVGCLPTNLETGEPGLTWARAALRNGADVVFADKGPLAVALPEVEAEAKSLGRFVGVSGTTGGALPSLTLGRHELVGTTVREISGVLNGTTNLMLTRMREGLTFDDALAEAQRLGIAEPDPRYDVEGWDTAVKILIITRALLDPSATLDRVDRRGIDTVAPETLAEAAAAGGRVRLVGRSRRTDAGAAITVAPEIVGPDDPFYLLEGKKKAVRFVSDDYGDLCVIGGASGRRDVAAAMLKDMIFAARERAR